MVTSDASPMKPKTGGLQGEHRRRTFTVHIDEGVWEAADVGVFTADDNGSCA